MIEDINEYTSMIEGINECTIIIEDINECTVMIEGIMSALLCYLTLTTDLKVIGVVIVHCVVK